MRHFIRIIFCVCLAALAFIPNASAEVSSNLRTECKYNAHGKILSAAFVDADGNWVIAEDKNYCYVINSYDNNRLASVEYFDTDKQPVLNSDGYFRMEQKWNGYGHLDYCAYYDLDGQLVMGPTGWAKELRSYGKTSENLLLSIEHLDAQGNLTSENCEYAKLVYDRTERSVTESYYDENGNLMLCARGYASLRKVYSYKTLVEEEYRDENGDLVFVPSKGYARYVLTTEGKKIVNEAYYGADDSYVMSKKGFAYCNYVYNPKIKPQPELLKEFFDENGEPCEQPGGFFKIGYSYDAAGRIRNTYYYDRYGELALSEYGYARIETYRSKNNIVTKERYFDANNKPMLVEELGCAGIRRDIVLKSKIGREDFLDVDGEIMLSDKGYTTVIYSYDDNKRVIDTSYYIDTGLKRRRANSVDGYATFSTEYYEDGSVVKAYKDKDGNLVDCAEGYARKVETYYQSNIASAEYFTATGEPAYSTNGYHKVTYVYDENTKVTEERYFDLNDTPMLSTKGYAAVLSEYSPAGILLARKYEDVNGNLITSSAGYAYVRYEIDGDGNRVSESYYGSDDQHVMIAAGYATIKKAYEGKLVLQENYLDTDGRPVTCAKGYAGIMYEYDSEGRKARTIYLDTSDQPVVLTGGYAGISREYNAEGRVAAETFIDTNGQPIAGNDGYATVRRAYNGAGSVTKEMYYDVQGAAVLAARGYAGWLKTYDDEKRVLTWTYIDTNEKPLALQSGYSTQINEYLDDQNAVRTTYLDESGKAVIIKDGYAAMEKATNSAGKNLSIAYFDQAGQPLVIPKGYATIKYDYPNAQTTRELYFDAAGQPIALKYGQCGQETTVLAEDRKRVTYLNATGEPSISTQGYAAIERVTDGEKRVTEESYFDEKGAPLAIPKGYAIIRTTYAEDGSKVVMYFGNDGQPCALKNGEYGLETSVTDDGWNRTAYMNAQGELQMISAGYAIIDKRVDDQKRATGERYFDTEGKPVAISKGYALATTEYAENGDACVMYFGADGQPCALKNGQYGQKTSVTDDGWSRTIYLDSERQPKLISAGYAIIDKRVDDKKRTTGERYFDTEGKPIAISKGYALVTTEYAENGDACVMYFGADYQPCELKNGEYGHKTTVTEDGWNRTIYLDGERQIKLITAGYAIIDKRIDDQKRLTGERYFDTEGKPIAISKGYALTTTEYTATGKRTLYFGVEGVPCALSDGSYGLETSETADGWSVKVYLDAGAAPVMIKKLGYAEIRTQKPDENTTRELYFDEAGQPVALKYGQYGQETVVLAENRKRVIYLDASGAPIISTLGYAAVERVTDGEKRVTEESYFDEKGAPLAIPKGYAIVRTTYAEDGSKVVMYCGTDGQPCELKNGEYGLETSVTEDGWNRTAYMNARGELKAINAGYAIIDKQVDDKKRVTGERYLDTKGKPVAISKGYALVTTEYAENGDTCVMYFGEDYQPCELKNGEYGHRTTITEDGWNRTIYLDGERQPKLINAGYAIMDKQFDDKKNVIGERYFDTEGEPVVISK